MQARRASARIIPDTIEGEARVLERHRISPSAPEPRAEPARAPINDNRPDTDFVFLRRAHRPDLVFQPAPPARAAQVEPERASPYRAHLAALGEEAARRQAAIGALVACLASLAAWSVTELPPHHPRSTLDASSSTTNAPKAAPAGGKTDRITLHR